MWSPAALFPMCVTFTVGVSINSNKEEFTYVRLKVPVNMPILTLLLELNTALEGIVPATSFPIVTTDPTPLPNNSLLEDQFVRSTKSISIILSLAMLATRPLVFTMLALK